jgi:hypothetical protein
MTTMGAMAVVLFVCSCHNDDSGPATPDLAVDSTAPPDSTTTRDLAPPLLLGRTLLMDIAATASVGPVRALVPIVSFGLSNAQHDFTNMNALGGCQGDHYDVVRGKVPPPDLDAGVVVFTGFQGGTLLDGTTAPNKISCARVNGFYQCGYGDLVNGMPSTPTTDQAPYAATATPIAKDSPITITGAGGPGFGPFSGMVTARDAPALLNGIDLSTVKYDPTSDFVFTYNCPTETNSVCGFTVVAVLLSISDEPPAMFGSPSMTSGEVLCIELTGSGHITVSKEALAAAFGCDAQGANCDSLLKSVRTTVVRLDPPANIMTNQAAMSRVDAAAGRGLSGVAPR